MSMKSQYWIGEYYGVFSNLLFFWWFWVFCVEYFEEWMYTKGQLLTQA